MKAPLAMNPKQVKCTPADHVEHAGVPFAGANLTNNGIGAVVVPVDLPHLLAHQRARATDGRGPRPPVAVAGDVGDSLPHRIPVCASIAACLTSCQRLDFPASRIGKLRVATTSPGVELSVRQKSASLPTRPPPELDRPVKRAGTTIAARTRVQDQAGTAAPDRLGNEGFQKRTDDELRIVFADDCLHRGRGFDYRDVDLMPKLGQGDPGALTQAVRCAETRNRIRERPVAHTCSRPRDSSVEAERNFLVHR